MANNVVLKDAGTSNVTMRTLADGNNVHTSYHILTNASNEDPIGTNTETAPASDTAASGLNGRLQRVAQRLTTLIGLFPSSLGRKAANASFSTALSTEDNALLSNVHSEIAGMRGDLNTPLVVSPPKSRVFLNTANTPSTAISVNDFVTAITNSSPVTIAPASANQVSAVFSAELDFTAACTLTIAGAKNFVKTIPAAGVYSLVDRDYPYAQSAVNTAITIAVSSGNCNATIYWGKGNL
jgi:hypothetical protein